MTPEKVKCVDTTQNVLKEVCYLYAISWDHIGTHALFDCEFLLCDSPLPTPPVHSARMAALSASLALPLHLNKHHLSWLVVYKICQEAATRWSRYSDLCPPREQLTGTLRWQGCLPCRSHAPIRLTPLSRSPLATQTALPLCHRASEMRRGVPLDASESHDDWINTSFGDACHQDWWFPGIFVVVLSVL